jgi:phosphate acetyltransferase
MIKSFTELAQETRRRLSGKPVPNAGIIYPGRGKCLEGVVQAFSEGYVKPSLIGPGGDIETAAAAARLDIKAFEIIDAVSMQEAVRKGIEMARAGRLQLLLKGSIGTKELVDVLKDPDSGFPVGGHQISHIGIVHTPRYHKLMFITDGAVNPAPSAAEKIEITRNAAAVAALLGARSPKAAFLAAVEAIYPAIPVTMEAAAIAKMSDRGQIKGVDIDGPLSFDVAISAEVAHSKGITDSRVAGDTDIFVAPTMETANGLYKAMVMYAKAGGAGIIYGGSVPLMTTFAVDPVQNLVNTLILGAYIVLK